MLFNKVIPVYNEEHKKHICVVTDYQSWLYTCVYIYIYIYIFIYLFIYTTRLLVVIPVSFDRNRFVFLFVVYFTTIFQ
jgi:hypothetical protein